MELRMTMVPCLQWISRYSESRWSVAEWILSDSFRLIAEVGVLRLLFRCVLDGGSLCMFGWAMD